MIPAELMLGALDGPWFHHCQKLTQSDLMLSVRAPDDSPHRQVLWQDQFDFACLSKPGCIEVHPWRFIRRVAMACNSREPWRKNGICIQIRHIRQSRLLQGRSRHGHERKQILLHRYPNSEPQACLLYSLTISWQQPAKEGSPVHRLDGSISPRIPLGEAAGGMHRRRKLLSHLGSLGFHLLKQVVCWWAQKRRP